MSKHICPECGQFFLKQITSKRSGKKFWVCQGPEETCNAIYGDDDGKPAFPQENPEAMICVEWLSERQQALTEWERDFVGGLMEKAEQQLDKQPLLLSEKQLAVIHKIADRFAEAPEF